MIFLLLSSCASCISRREVNAVVWNTRLQLPQEVCNQFPGLDDPKSKMWRGVYRKLDNGKYEILNVCKEEIKNYKALHNDDLNEILNKLIRKK